MEKLKKIKQTENEVKKAITDYLVLNGYKVYRINNTGIHRGKDKNGKDRFSFAGTPGVSDLYATKAGNTAFWIEVKATGKKPNKKQEDFMRDINYTKGTFSVWADSLDMFMEKCLI